jgi:hypothetical protein
MSDAKGAIGADEEWHLWLIHDDEEVQPYRTAPTAWPISAEEVKRSESQAVSSNASAVNNLGTVSVSNAGPVVHGRQLCLVCVWQE